MNAVEIEEAISLLAEQPFVPADFPYAFLEAFGNKETTIKRLKSGNNNKSDVDRGVLQQNNIHIAACDEGKVLDTLNKLKVSAVTTKFKAKFILATDGKEFQAEDVNSGETVACNYSDFHNHFGFFLPLAGISTVKQIRENAFDIKATSRLNKLYIELLSHNPEWATAERRQDMNHFLARLIFCFFAEDTGIFEGDGLFTETVQRMSSSDASDTHQIISEIFRAMDAKKEDRAEKKVKNWAVKFPYVNGQLFSGSTETPKFTKIARSYLLHVGNLDWKKINPDIFGSMIQAVADDDERGALGMHYTSVPNILKVLNPLFLDDLRAQLEEAGDNARKLLNLRKRISRIRVFDPACGSGNFLVIAYKEMRKIEYELNALRGEIGNPTEIPLTNFRGIELRGFSAEIARLALIIAEYQCDVLYRGQKLALAEFLPLNAENWITCGNALKINWLSICPPTGTDVRIFKDELFDTSLDQAEIEFENEGGETYICGNPPYAGLSSQEKEQKADLELLFSSVSKYWKSFDYVCGWLWKSALFLKNVNGKCAFVATNSVCQGQQVPMFWQLILSEKLRIDFAHTSFKWKNLAANNAGVIVVIVALASPTSQKPKLYSESVYGEPYVKSVENINAYLVSGSNIFIEPRAKAPEDRHTMYWGNKPTDGGFLILSPHEAHNLVSLNENIEPYLKLYYGSTEFINSNPRVCIWVNNKDVEKANKYPELKERFESVRKFRASSKAKETRPAANFPHRFRQIQGKPGTESIIIPIHTSESREYLPVGLLSNKAIVSNAAYALYDAGLKNISLIASKLHLVWIATVCGKIKTDFRYSNTLGWNTFPVPPLTEKNNIDLTACAEEILIARERHFPATIADLYDPEKMPEDLRQAHDRNDEVLERIYIGRRFKNDTERLEKLFELYTYMTTKTKTA
jgi:hypothetical protein